MCNCPPGNPFRSDYVPTIVWSDPKSDGRSETQTRVKDRLKEERGDQYVEPKLARASHLHRKKKS